MPIFSSLDKDQIKVVIDKVTRWLDLAEEGDWMTLPGIAGKGGCLPDLGVLEPVTVTYQGSGAIPSPSMDLGIGSADVWSLREIQLCSQFRS